MMQSGSGGKSGARATYLFYRVIAVLLNAVLALAWVIWREAELNQKQQEQIIERRSQMKGR